VWHVLSVAAWRWKQNVFDVVVVVVVMVVGGGGNYCISQKSH